MAPCRGGLKLQIVMCEKNQHSFRSLREGVSYKMSAWMCVCLPLLLAFGVHRLKGLETDFASHILGGNLAQDWSKYYLSIHQEKMCIRWIVIAHTAHVIFQVQVDYLTTAPTGLTYVRVRLYPIVDIKAILYVANGNTTRVCIGYMYIHREK